MTDTTRLARAGVVLPVGAPPVFRNPCGRGVLVDFGGILPEVFATFDAAAAEIAARLSPVAGPHRSGGTAPGFGLTPPEAGPGAPMTLIGRVGGAPTGGD